MTVTTRSWWATCEDPKAMLGRLQWAPERKLRLFACAVLWSARKWWGDSCRDQGPGCIRGVEDWVEKGVLPENWTSPDRGRKVTGMEMALNLAYWGEDSWGLSKVYRADLLREIFRGCQQGRKPACSPPPFVMGLAEAAYWHREGSPAEHGGLLDRVRLSVLADAVEERGEDDSLVAHLRGEGPHFRGCWAVDLLRGVE